MKTSKAIHWGALGALALGLASGEGCHGGGLVGGDCSPGWTACDAECVDLDNDPSNCGACDNTCRADQTCQSGSCVGNLGVAGGGGIVGAGSGGQGHDVDGQSGGMSTGGRGSSDNGGGEGGIAGEGGRGAEGGGGGASGAESGSSGAGQGGVGGIGGVAGHGAGSGGKGGAGQGGTQGSAGQGGANGTGGQSGTGGNAGQAGTGGDAGQGGIGGDAGQAGAGQAGAGQAGAGQAGAGQGGSGPPCPPPLELCIDVCVDLQNDEYNCGSCGNVCPTGVCQSGACVGARTGHEVVVGFDYASVPAGSVDPKRLLGNAVYLAAAQSNGSWKMLGFDPHGSPTRGTVDVIVAQQASSHGISNLSVSYAVDTSELLAQLSIQSFDALLVYDQPGAPAGALASEGATVELALRSFSSAGGTVVVLGGGGGVNEMWAFVQSANILPTVSSSRLSLPTSLHNSAPADGVGIGVATVFAARPNTASWLLSSPEGTVVVDTSLGAKPIVIHKPVLP
jgi:hypothetical protein